MIGLITICVLFRGEPGPGEVLLMASQSGDGVHRMSHTAVATRSAPPFIAHELCREHLGVHPCDRRRPTREYRERFPGIDWSLISEEEDVLWTKDHRETKAEITARGRDFLLWLMKRPETSIAVVTHSSFLHYTCNSFGQDFSMHIKDELHRCKRGTGWLGCCHGDSKCLTSFHSISSTGFENCEMRTLVIANNVEPLEKDRFHFHGSLPMLKHD